MAYPENNYTQIPNILLDEQMRDMGIAELKVVLCAARKIMGYHKATDGISLSQFEEMTGLSRQGVIDGVAQAIQRGVLIEVGTGKRGVKLYELHIVSSQASRPVKPVDQSSQLTRTSQASRPELVKPVDTQKKLRKKIEEKDIAPAKADGGISSDSSGNITPDETLPDNSPATPKRKRSAKQLENDRIVEALAAAWGIPPAGNDYSNYVKVAQTLLDAGISDFADYIQDTRRRAKTEGDWKVTLNSLITNGRMSEYLARKAKVIPYPANGSVNKTKLPEIVSTPTDDELDAILQEQLHDYITFEPRREDDRHDHHK